MRKVVMLSDHLYGPSFWFDATCVRLRPMRFGDRIDKNYRFDESADPIKARNCSKRNVLHH